MLTRRDTVRSIAAAGLGMLGAPRVWAKAPQPFPDDPFLTGFYAPVSTESDQPQLRISGELPKELLGTLYRNGPNPQFETKGSHWFVGDGMLHAFHIENGRASYRNRWIHTPKFLAEHDAGRALYRGFGQKMPDAPASLGNDLSLIHI